MFLGIIWLLTSPQICSTQLTSTTCSSCIEIYLDPVPLMPLLYTSSTKVLFLGRIETIQEKAFIKNPKLERVEFMGTSTTSVEAGAFQGLTDLKTLEISGTNLSLLPDEIFKNLKQLVTLYLTQNKIEDITENLFNGLTKLRDLRLNSNNISSISMKAFDNLEQLQTLDLSKNNLAKIPDDIWSGKLTNLEEINIQDNKITYLQTSSKSHEKLERLFLGNNLLNELPKEAFAHLPVLKILGLQKNNIASFSQGVFSKLTQLALLDISNNKIENLPQGVFEGLGKLSELNLEGNLIHTLKAEALPSLKTLKLSNNKLKSLTGVPLEVFGKIENVYLDDNPWLCDCEMSDYLEKPYNFTIFCMYPEALKKQNLSSLTKHSICPNTTPSEKMDTSTKSPDASKSSDVLQPLDASKSSDVSQPPPNYQNGPTKEPTSYQDASKSSDVSQPPPNYQNGPTKEPTSYQVDGTMKHNWSNVSRIILATIAPLLTLLFLFILARLYTRTRGYSVRPVDPRLQPIKLVDEDNCKLLYVHELPETISPPEHPAVLS
ncbi:carboxypeptidase N subunit 2-like isoform X3 [Alosa sapidissima]|uniref:carboxypeptidase N subunit 2-like isoform X3 n=1 Tax=Alosa sapidissima TaxID=34773 RepID=UPI001C08A7D0|nr:carboxypeptidase N subunit 2-like isoform X3 [Alosa sapidissima]